ncbi:MAG: TlpA family protein disulfide reductase [Gammaproteobacteria bacterium]|nr:TlpA family protein disulfide reductase [Gammaproteobacteria bacterium]MDH5660444.1 TlpA family protein disulfide reductase [Gammaproteobacteria bacterium]
MSYSRFFTTFLVRKLTVFSLVNALFFSPFVLAEMKGLEDFNGKHQLLENYTGKGKWLIVMMWASDCHICNIEAHQYVDFHMIHSDNDATVLGISLDGDSQKKEARKFIKKHSIDFPNLIAEPEYVSNLYRELTGQIFAGTPSFLIFSPDGELKAAQAGAVPTILIEEFIKKNQIKKTVRE